MAPNLITLLACIACLMAAFAVGVRGMLLAPATQTWPEGPKAIRLIMFAMALVLTWFGMTVLFQPQSHRIDWMVAVVLIAHATYQMGMLINILRQNYPARFWRAMNRIQKLASCPPAGADTLGVPWISYSTSDHLRPSQEA